MRGPAVLLAALVALAGCGRLPVSGPVVSSPRLADDPGFGLLQVLPEGPVPGATPVQVVAGFLRAASSSDADSAVARSFLSARAAARWRPEATTTVVRQAPSLAEAGAVGPAGVPRASGAPDPAQGEAGAVAVVLEAAVVARIDAQGRRAEQPPGESLSQRLLLRREREEWRIDVLPDGLVVSAADASRTFRAYPLAFATPDGSQLVPEVRWFASTQNTATRIVRELLRGPSPWLAPALTTGAPLGTSLRLGSVPVADGTASVDLSDAARVATPQQRRLLLSQLRESLLRVPGVLAVRVTVGGVELSGPAGQPDVPVERPPRDSRLLVLGPEGLARYDGAQLVTVAAADGASGAGALAAPAVGPQGGAYAVLGGQRHRLLLQRPGTAAVVAAESQDELLPPGVDRHGWVWTGTAAGALVLPAAAPGAGASPVQGPPGGLEGRLVRLRVSRDGTRALLVTVRGDGTPLVAVHGVDRDGTGRPLRLTARGPLLVPGAEEVLDLSWLGPDRAAVLVRRPGEVAPRPVLVQVGGPAQPLPPVPGAVSIAAATTERGVVVGTADGRLLVRSGADWIVVVAGRDPAYPG